MEYFRFDTLREYGLKPEDMCVTFDYSVPDAEFTSCIDRTIGREEDGFYHCAKGEWESFRGMTGVTLFDGAEW